MASEIGLDEIVLVIRAYSGIPERTPILAESKLEDDLGITGDDGCELLEELERKFNISFSDNNSSWRKAFNLAEDEFLFHSEGVDLWRWIAGLFGKDAEKVKPFTVGELHQVVVERANANRT